MRHWRMPLRQWMIPVEAIFSHIGVPLEPAIYCCMSHLGMHEESAVLRVNDVPFPIWSERDGVSQKR